MTPDVALLHAVERALAARGRTKFLERVGAWAPGPHRHQKWVLSDAEFRAVPLRGQVLREVRKDIVYFRLQKHVEQDQPLHAGGGHRQGQHDAQSAELSRWARGGEVPVGQRRRREAHRQRGVRVAPKREGGVSR